MAFTPDTPATIEQAQLASYANRFAGRDTGSESFLGKLARAEAQGLWSFQTKLQRISLDSVPNAQTTYARLADWATAIGLPDGAGGYGPLKATAATGLVGTATGTNGSTIPQGTQLVAADGTTLFATTDNPATIPIAGFTSIHFNATTAGTAGNLQTPATLTFVSPPAGINALVTLTQGTSNGTDQESLAALFARIQARMQNPPKGGTQADWDFWALAEAVLLTIARSYGYARRNGTGTVDEVVVYAPNALGTGASRQVSGGDLTTIATYIDTVRPVTVEGRRMLTPTLVSGLTLRSRIVATAIGAFDWSSNTLGFTVNAYSVGTGTGGGDQVTLSADAPADLQAAIAAGSQPRVQIVSTHSGANIVTLQARAVAYTQVAGPKAKLDLLLADVQQQGWSTPNNGDAVYSGGPATAAIAAAQLAYVNGLGPSRASGFADPGDSWQDTVETAQLARIALETVDASGRAYAQNIVKIAGVPQVTIAIGAGSPSTNDYVTADNGSTPPEIAFATHVVVTD